MERIKTYDSLTRWRQIKQSGAFLLLVMLLGCGHKNPLASAEKKNPALDHVVPSYNYTTPVAPTPKTYKTLTSLVQFTTDGTMVFVQGEPGVYNIEITGPIRQTNANYKLVLDNNDVSSLGATLKPTSVPWQWQLQWTPPYVLAAGEKPVKTFQVPVQFVLTGSNSAKLQNALAGQTIEAPLDITLTKDETTPIVQDVTPQTVKINAGQDVTINFSVLAKSFGQASNISVHRINGVCDLSQDHEYPLCGGALETTQPVLVGTQSAANGYTRFQYRTTFSGQEFADRMYKKLAANGYWNWKLNAGEIKFAEARLSFEAINNYNHEWSADPTVAIDVTLNTRAGQPTFIDGTSHVQVTAGSSGMPALFMIGTRGGRGNLKIQSAKLDGQPITVRNNQMKLEENGVAINLECKDAGVDLTKSVNCHTGECLQLCSLQVDANKCVQGPLHKNLVLTALSSLGRSTQTGTITLPIDVNGSSNSCAAKNIKSPIRVMRARPRKGAKS